MKLIKYPSKEQWAELLKRPALNTESLFDTVRSIIDKVKAEGDKAVLEYEAAFDKVTLSALAVSPKEIQAAGALVSDDLKVAISLAKQNIETFHSSQRFVGKKVETMKGVTCWQKSVGIEKVGLYIPGGTAPLFSTVLMLAVPAKIAGCKEIVLCTPPDKPNWQESAKYSRREAYRPSPLWRTERKACLRFIKFSVPAINM